MTPWKTGRESETGFRVEGLGFRVQGLGGVSEIRGVPPGVLVIRENPSIIGVPDVRKPPK